LWGQGRQGTGIFYNYGEWAGNLNQLEDTKGYWLNVDCDLEWIVNIPNLIKPNDCYSFDLNIGHNLLTYFGGEEFSTIDAMCNYSEFVLSIVGEGYGLFNTVFGWSGNLHQLEKFKGYWVNTNNGSLDFTWGCDCQEFSLPTVTSKIIESDYDFLKVNQSMEQAFYLIKEIGIDGESPKAEDLILAYQNDILIGSANYSELTVLAVMGRDLSEQTIGFIETGQIPTLKLLKASGELVDLEADLEPFSNLLVSEVQSVIGSTAIIPTDYALHPAYPNPFNPVTTIKFGVPAVESLRVTTLQIYDINGRLIETLINGQIESGLHSINWNAEGNPSGVYFIKMVSGDPSINSGQGFMQSQKVILMK